MSLFNDPLELAGMVYTDHEEGTDSHLFRWISVLSVYRRKLHTTSITLFEQPSAFSGKAIYNCHLIMWNRLFYLKWLLFNLIGFISGSYLGATSSGLIPAWVPGISGIILGDLVFGSVIGLFQWLVLRNNRRLPISAWWIVLLSLGFTFGARAGSLLTYPIANGWLMPSLVFGVFMGGSTGLAVIPLFWKNVLPNRLIHWLAISVLGWILGETIAFVFHFAQSSVPLVALVISGVKGLGILWLQSSTNIPDG